MVIINMKLPEFEGKSLFRRYGIPTPQGVVLEGKYSHVSGFNPPYAVKAQTLSGMRRQERGIVFVAANSRLRYAVEAMRSRKIGGEAVKKVLVEEKINPIAEYYVSLSYDADTRSPALALSTRGGSGIKKAKVFKIDIMLGAPSFFLRSALLDSGFPKEDLGGVSSIVQNLWELFIKEYALLAEINPLFKTKEGKFIAGDAKIILDDEKVKAGDRRLISMEGDIAVMASGGGASMLNIDALLYHGGRPANYAEYSGNPPAQVVKELTRNVLNRKKLKGCWVVGGVANFTDIFETMRGFVEGLREVRPKPIYPIVIRRDGPRQKEAFEMLKEVAQKEKYNFHLFGSETPMEESAKIMTQLAYGK